MTLNKTNLFLSITSLVIGILFIVIPQYVLKIMFFIIGAGIIVFGLYNIIHILHSHKNELETYKTLLFTHTMILIIGIVFEAVAYFFIYVFIIILAIIMILFGSYKLYASIVEPSLFLSNRILQIIISSFTILIGIILLVNLNQSINWIMYLLGALLIINGLIEGSCFIKELVDYNKEKEKIKKTVIDVDVKETTIDE